MMDVHIAGKMQRKVLVNVDNVSQIRLFSLSGLNETMNYRVTLFSLSLLCYCVIVLVNVSLIVTIVWDKNLHEPMYILLCIFCMNGLYGTTGFYPKFLWDLVSPVHVISYSGCLVQALVMNSFSTSELSILAVMAYDRYVAICRPLEYHSIMSKQRLVILGCYSMLTPCCILGINVTLASRLKLCSSNISRLYCLNWIIVKLACYPADTVINNIVANISILIFVGHGIFILFSYMYVIRMCVNSIENTAKFMQTCVPHLTSLLAFLATFIFDVLNMRLGSNDFPQSFQNFLAIVYLVIPPILNPVIYGFKLTKIRKKFWGFIILKVKL